MSSQIIKYFTPTYYFTILKFKNVQFLSKNDLIIATLKLKKVWLT